MGPNSRTRTHGKTRAKPAGIPVPVMFTTRWGGTSGALGGGCRWCGDLNLNLLVNNQRSGWYALVQI